MVRDVEAINWPFKGYLFFVETVQDINQMPCPEPATLLVPLVVGESFPLTADARYGQPNRMGLWRDE